MASGGDLASVAVEHLAADCKAEAAALIGLRAVQPFERIEDAFAVAILKADAVVLKVRC